MDGRELHFHLAGINNQNFIMRDEETGSWWQQVSGEAILGPLAGRRLAPTPFEEVSFALWRKENPAGRVLRPDAKVAAADHYARADWEERTGKLPVPVKVPDGKLEPRALVEGVVLNGKAKAYPHAALAKQGPVMDMLGGVPLLIAMGEDGRTVRAFDRRVDGEALEIFAVPDSTPPLLVDSQTGSTWDFSGIATEGPLSGRRLARVAVLPDYWFDWRIYHPETTVYELGDR